MSSLNKHQIIGNLGRDPEVRYTQSNICVATLSVATSEKWKDNNGNVQERTEWHRCIAWKGLAEVARKYLKKGSKVYLDGPLQTNTWEDKEGVKRYTTEMKVRSMVMLDSKSGQRNEEPPSPEDNVVPDEDDGDDSLPF